MNKKAIAFKIVNIFFFASLSTVPFVIFYFVFYYSPTNNDVDLIPQVLHLSKAASHIIKKNNVSVETSSKEITKLISEKAPDLLKPLDFYDYSFQTVYVNNTIEIIVNVYKKNSFILKDISTTPDIIEESRFE